ncbi:MAG: glycosyltransferase [Chloroflexota bacterium]
MNRRLIWVSTINPFETLDVATWLVTTRELRHSGWDVQLIGFGPDGNHQVNDTEIICFPWPNTYFLGQSLYHLRVLRFLWNQFNEADFILFHQISALWMLPLILYRAILRKDGPLLVMDTRDLMDITQGSIKARLRMAFYQFVYSLAPFAFDGQTTITPQMAKLIKIPEEQLWGIWPSGVEPKRYQTASDNRRWPQKDEPIHLMYLGILLQKRNPIPLCRAVIRANEEGMNFNLTFVGSGPEEEKIKPFVEESKGCISLLEPIAHSEVPSMLARAHVGVTSLPEPGDTKYEASSPIKIFEYLAAGLPILATTNICHTHVVGQGEYAFWVDEVSDDVILQTLHQIWEQKDSLPSLGDSAIGAAAQWSWQAASQKLENALLNGLNASQVEAHIAPDENLRTL